MREILFGEVPARKEIFGRMDMSHLFRADMTNPGTAELVVDKGGKLSRGLWVVERSELNG